MAYFNGYQPAYAPNPGFQQYPQMNYQQQRMDYLQSMQQPQQTQQPGDLQARIVTSREEAVAAQTDYFSAGLVMPDLGHGTIYLKRFNPQTGASDFFEFRAVQEEKAEETETEVLQTEEGVNE